MLSIKCLASWSTFTAFFCWLIVLCDWQTIKWQIDQRSVWWLLVLDRKRASQDVILFREMLKYLKVSWCLIVNCIVVMVFTARALIVWYMLLLHVCLFVSVAVTSRCSTKTAKHRITVTVPHECPGIPIFLVPNSSVSHCQPITASVQNWG